jgi:nucleotide sugar dehydrogenase
MGRSDEPAPPAVVDSVAVVGLGYVGLPTALALTGSGCDVVGFDVSEGRLAAIKRGAVDLPSRDVALLGEHLGLGALRLTTNPAALGDVDAVIICVPTPVDDHHVPDLTALTAACGTVARHHRPGQLIVLSSTTYVGCTRDLLVKPLRDAGLSVGVDVFVAFSPERIDPGNPRHRQDGVPRVVGGVTAACLRRATALLRRITPNIHAVSSPEAAEVTKLLENCFRAANIALVNEFADACRELDLEVVEVIEAAATKPYGFMPFYPGPGVGGHCIPCDPHYLLWQLRARRTRLPVTEVAMTAIALRPRQVVDRIRDLLAGGARSVAGARVLVVGVTYKPGVADLRGSPALEIMAELLEARAEVGFVDPLVDSVIVAGRVLDVVTDPDEVGWDLVVVHTLHSGLDYDWLARHPMVLDATYRAAQIPDRAVL